MYMGMKLFITLALASVVVFLIFNSIVLERERPVVCADSPRGFNASTCPSCICNCNCPIYTPCVPSSETCTPCPAAPTCAPTTPEVPKIEYPAGLLSVKRIQPRYIIDIFTFGHELDWLEIRLNELNDEVEYFVIIEGEKTFSNKKKELFYWNNKEKFSLFHDKIIHVNCTNESDGYFENERLARECSNNAIQTAVDKLIQRGIKFNNEDIICMNSDLDEIPRPAMMNKWRWHDPMPPLPGRVEYHFYYYSFHWSLGVGWTGTTVTNYQNAIASGGFKGAIQTKFYDGGWHCSSCLTPENLKYKIQTFSHTELDKPEIVDLVHLNDSIVNGKDWAFREGMYNFQATPRLGDMPRYLLQNMDKFPNLPPLDKYSKSQILEASLKYSTNMEIWRIGK